MKMKYFANKKFFDNEIGALEIEGEPWFEGKKIATVLGYCNAIKALDDYVDTEDKFTPKEDCESKEVTFINESGFDSLMPNAFSSRKQDFKDWIKSYVIPQLVQPKSSSEQEPEMPVKTVSKASPQIQTFYNEEFGKIRVLEINGDPWFVGKDVANILGYERATKAVNDHVDTEDIDAIPIRDSIGRMQNTPIINESGLYSLALSSKLPTAKKFKHWVTSKVLPSIRKHGMYAKDELLDNPDLLLEVVTKLRDERSARIEAENQRNLLIHQNKLYTTTELAKELGFSSASALNKDLNLKKVQYKRNDTWVLYSKYAKSGYVSIKQTVLDNGAIIYNRKWTGAGRDFVLHLYNDIA